MKKKISVVLVILTVIMIFSACNPTKGGTDDFSVKNGESFTVTVKLTDSGAIKSMALSIFFDDDAFLVVDGTWLNHNGEIADFNKETKDAAIAFKDEVNFSGEIFSFTLKAKKDLVIIKDVIMVEAVLKNENEDVECKGISLTYAK